MLGSESIDFAATRGNRALGNPVCAVIDIVVQHANAMPVNRGTSQVRNASPRHKQGNVNYPLTCRLLVTVTRTVSPQSAIIAGPDGAS